MASVRVNLAGGEVAKWLALRFRPRAGVVGPTLEGTGVTVAGLDAPIYRDLDPAAGELEAPYLGDAALSLQVYALPDPSTVTRLELVTAALELANVATRGLVDRAEALSVEVDLRG